MKVITQGRREEKVRKEGNLQGRGSILYAVHDTSEPQMIVDVTTFFSPIAFSEGS